MDPRIKKVGDFAASLGLQIVVVNETQLQVSPPPKLVHRDPDGGWCTKEFKDGNRQEKAGF